MNRGAKQGAWERDTMSQLPSATWKWQILLLLHSTSSPVKHTTKNGKDLDSRGPLAETTACSLLRSDIQERSPEASVEPGAPTGANAQLPHVPQPPASPEQHLANRLELLKARRLEVLFQA